MSKTGIPELDAIIAAASKAFEIDLGAQDYGNIKPLPTGSLTWDIATKIGGLPRGRVIEVYGDESTGKTSFCLAAIASAQRIRKSLGTNKRDLIVDLEHAMSRSFIEGFGIDFDQIIWIRPESVEQALQICIDYPKSGAIDTVLFDSVDAGQNEKQLRRNIGEVDVGGISKDMNNALRRIIKVAADTETTYMFVNQVKMNPGVSFGNPRVTPGGRALAYYASLRIEFLKRDKIKDLPNATEIRGKLRKSKMGGDSEEEISAALVYGRGYDETYDINTVCVNSGILRHSAGRTMVRWNSTSEEVPLDPEIEKGKAGAFEYLANNPNVRERLRHAALRAAGLPFALTDEQVLEKQKEKNEIRTIPDNSTAQ